MEYHKHCSLPFIAFMMAATLSITGSSQTIIPLYSDSIPNSRSVPDQEESEVKDNILRISKVSRPTLTIYAPPGNKRNGAAVIICPGGGYTILAAAHEGEDVAKQFTEMGVTAFEEWMTKMKFTKANNK